MGFNTGELVEHDGETRATRKIDVGPLEQSITGSGDREKRVQLEYQEYIERLGK